MGARASSHAKYFTEQIQGNKIRSANDAIKAFEQYKVVNGSKFNHVERRAMANALRSIEYSSLSRNLNKMSKGLGFYGIVSDSVDLLREVITATETNNWRGVIVKLEKLAAGKLASALTAFAFSIIFSTSIGIIGYAIIMALVGSLINDSLIKGINAKLGFK